MSSMNRQLAMALRISQIIEAMEDALIGLLENQIDATLAMKYAFEDNQRQLDRMEGKIDEMLKKASDAASTDVTPTIKAPHTAEATASQNTTVGGKKRPMDVDHDVLSIPICCPSK